MGKSSFILAALLFFLSLLPLLWFPGQTILLGYDNVFPLAPVSFMIDRVYSWTDTLGFGSDQSGIQGSLPIHFFDVLPQLFYLSHQQSQQVTTVFWFFLILFSAYFFVRRLEKVGLINSGYVRYFFPALYALNFYILQAWWIFERTKFSLVVATPFILSIVIPLLHSKKSWRDILRSAIACSFVLSIFNGGGWLGISLYGGLILLVICLLLTYLPILHIQKKYSEISKIALFFLLFGFFWLLLNAYTFLPFLSTTFSQYGALLDRSGGIESILGWTKYISQNTSFLNLLRLQGIPDWYGNTNYHPYASTYLYNPAFVVLGLFFPLLLVLSTKFLHKFDRKFSIFCFLSVLVSLVFVSGDREPFGFIFELLTKHLPGFVIFRSAIFKFGYAYWLSTGLLISLALSEVVSFLVRALSSRFEKKWLELSIPLLVIVALVVYHFPYLNGNIFHIDKTSVASRVVLPTYVKEFSSWWNVHGKDQKVLLLPKLNMGWHFEIYKWNYLSLNPVLTNFANSGIVENSVLVNSQESLLLDLLYEAIANGRNEQSLRLSKLLGIEFILIRKDFYADYPGIETDDPNTLLKAVKTLPSLKKVNTFGEWELFRFKGESPLFFSESSASLISSAPDGKKELTLPIQVSVPDDQVESVQIMGNCLNCQADQIEIGVTFPTPKILIDSFFYQLVELKRKIFERSSNLTFDDLLFTQIGDTLKQAAMISELLQRNRPDSFVEKAMMQYESSLDTLLSITGDIPKSASNRYYSSVLLKQYVEAEMRYISGLFTQVGTENQKELLEKSTSNLVEISEIARLVYDRENMRQQKFFSFDVSEEGEYRLKVRESSFGILNEGKDQQVNAVFKNSQKTLAGKVSEEGIDFGIVYLAEGAHSLALTLPLQKNLLSEPISQSNGARSCFVTTTSNFDRDKTYLLEFSVVNNFTSQLVFTLSDGKDSKPRRVERFPFSGEEVNKRNLIIKPGELGFSSLSKKATVSFCSKDLDLNRYTDNITNLRLEEIPSPIMYLERSFLKPARIPPPISFRKENQVKYLVTVEDARDPFFLVSSLGYAPGWQSELGEHLIGNSFANVWRIDKVGTYTFSIEYKPQRFFVYGILISVSTLISLLCILFFLRKSK